MSLTVREQRVQNEAAGGDPARELGLDDGPRIPCGTERPDDLVRRDQPKRVTDGVVDPDLEPVWEAGTRRPPETAEVDDLGVVKVIVVVRKHRVRASWRAMRR